MIRVYTKQRHVWKVGKFLSYTGLDHEIFTIKDSPPSTSFDLGVSYGYGRLITDPELSVPPRGFINYHPAPLPRYKGPTELIDAIANEEMEWGVTVHFMDKTYDTGPIIAFKPVLLHEPPKYPNELGPISHYFLFSMFKDTIVDIYNNRLKGTSQSLWNS